MGRTLVIKYDSALPCGRAVVGDFDTDAEAKQFAEGLSGDVRFHSRKREVFQPSVEHIHRLRDRTFGDSPAPKKVTGGLQWGDEFWPYDQRGSGPDGRAIPGDIWLWARVAEHRSALAEAA